MEKILKLIQWRKTNNRGPGVLLGVFLATLFSFYGAFNWAIAQTPPAPVGGLTNEQIGLPYAAATGLGATDVRLTAARLVRTAMGLLGVVAVVIIIYAGFLWMTAGGNEEKVTEAKKWLYGGVIGLALILSAYSLATFVVNSLVGATDYGLLKIF